MSAQTTPSTRTGAQVRDESKERRERDEHLEEGGAKMRAFFSAMLFLAKGLAEWRGARRILWIYPPVLGLTEAFALRRPRICFLAFHELNNKYPADQS